jgi:hypothetical protein
MEFGYFTLSDNHYENNPRDAIKFVADITAEAITKLEYLILNHIAQGRGLLIIRPGCLVA